MNWFIFALICILGWGLADLFYKKGNKGDDRYSHLKTAVWVGLMMGFVAGLLLLFTAFKEPLSGVFGEEFVSYITAETLLDPDTSIFMSAVKYLPASLSYIISMVIGYAGLRYLELSIVSPVQNASGALSAICMFIWFTFTGRVGGFWEEFSILDVIGTAIIVAGMIALAIVEQRLAKAEGALNLPKSERKYRYGALALLFPILYCLFDTMGTAADGIILDGAVFNGRLGEIDVIILYGLTFFAAGVCAWFFLLIREKKPYNPFEKHEIATKGVAAVFEQFGQIFYVYAMAKEPMLAAPMVASYCIVSVILSRIFLKEKLKPAQYACVFAVIFGIVILGVSEGLGEAEIDVNAAVLSLIGR